MIHTERKAGQSVIELSEQDRDVEAIPVLSKMSNLGRGASAWNLETKLVDGVLTSGRPLVSL